ncbi:MAG: hypothetical protein ACKO8Q_02025 [Bacteroidota bacterium]
MIKLLNFFLLLFTFSGTILSQTEEQLWAIKQLEVLAPNEFLILKNYDDLPESYSVECENGSLSSYKTSGTYEYLSIGSRFNVLNSLSINVHEINHGLTSGKAFIECERRRMLPQIGDLLYYFQFPDGQGELLVSSIKFFPSSELISEIPLEKRTFRFDTYIEGNSSTQNDGLLGLLDEYNAYLHSLETVFLLKDAYLRTSENMVDNYVNWRSQMKSYECSFYEFNFYVLLYLDFARRNSRDIYDAVRNDVKFSKVYNEITEQFQLIINKLETENKQGIYQFAKQNSLTLKFENGTYWLKSGNLSTGISYALEDRDKLIGDLTSSRFDPVRKELGLIK